MTNQARELCEALHEFGLANGPISTALIESAFASYKADVLDEAANDIPKPAHYATTWGSVSEWLRARAALDAAEQRGEARFNQLSWNTVLRQRDAALDIVRQDRGLDAVTAILAGAPGESVEPS